MRGPQHCAIVSGPLQCVFGSARDSQQYISKRISLALSNALFRWSSISVSSKHPGKPFYWESSFHCVSKRLEPLTICHYWGPMIRIFFFFEKNCLLLEVGGPPFIIQAPFHLSRAFHEPGPGYFDLPPFPSRHPWQKKTRKVQLDDVIFFPFPYLQLH